MALTIFTTPTCRHCATPTNIVVDRDAVTAFHAGTPANEAFAALSIADIALIRTGTHPECEQHAMQYALACFGDIGENDIDPD